MCAPTPVIVRGRCLDRKGSLTLIFLSGRGSEPSSSLTNYDARMDFDPNFIPRSRRGPLVGQRVALESADPVPEPAPSAARTGVHAVLRPLNAVLALVHAAAAVTVVALSSAVPSPVYRTPLAPPELSSEGSVVLAPATPERVFDVDLGWYTAAFFGVTALAHARAAICHERYVGELLQCRNAYRWLEYAVSASIMASCVAYFCTNSDAFLLLGVIALTSSTMCFGHLAELVARPGPKDAWTVPLATRLQPHVLGYLPQGLAWVIILVPFYLNTVDTEMPRFVYAIFLGQLVVFWSFGLVQLVVLLLRPSAYVYGELSYVVLSAAGKLLLGGQLLVNVLWAGA